MGIMLGACRARSSVAPAHACMEIEMDGWALGEQEQRSSRSSQATYVSGVACARSQIGSCQVDVGDGMIEALESGVQRTGVPHELGQSHNCTCKPNKVKVNSVRKCFS